MESFLYTMLGSFICAISWIAYKHPKSYERLYKLLNTFIMLAGAVIGSYSFGYQHGQQALSKTEYPFSQETNITIFILLFGALILINILKSLPLWLDLPTNNDGS